jgi:Ca-activated chloride channel homolog
MNVCRSLTSTAVLALLIYASASLRAQDAQSSDAQQPDQAPRATFKSAVDLVSIAAVVRDRHGRFARDLKQDDFVVLEGRESRPIVEFHAAQDAPVRVALLFDVSGSMRLGSKLEEARQAARHVVGALNLDSTSRDEAAVFSFDMNLQALQPFTADSSQIETALSRVKPYGQTSLYDAIAQTARNVAEASPGDRHRRAVIVLTDGVDTSSEMTPAEVSSIASSIDVPVYVVTVASPLDYAAGNEPLNDPKVVREGKLRTLAHWTGGELFVVSAPAHESMAARQIVDELRHQYVLGVSASAASREGWRQLSVHIKDRDFTVRARSGYSAGTRIGS